jgi:hypothetical protein
MAISFASLSTPAANTANQSTAYTGTAGTAQAQDILIAFVSVSGNTTAGTMAGGSLTWTLVTSGAKATNVDLCLVYWAYVPATVSVTPSYTPSAAATGCIIAVTRVVGSTGTSGALNLVQAAATATGATANPTITFGAATNTANGILVLAANGTNSTAQFTAPTGFTELIEVAYNTPTNGVETAYRISGGTATTYTWTNVNTTSWRTFGLEFAPAVATSFDPMGMMGFFGM